MPALDFAATHRNREVLLEVLKSRLPASGVVLEIGSGSGQHHVHFGTALPHLNWQPTDLDPDHLRSITAWQDLQPSAGLLPAKKLDLLKPWPVKHADAVLCFNVIHISPWACTAALFQGAGQVLPKGGRLFTYGPYTFGGVHTSQSNVRFQGLLESMDPDFGVRDADELMKIALENGLALVEKVAMPANNFTLVFEKTNS
ncbi:MAG: SAM-dependent methyltransferase [Cognaticolwellia sp.]|jgi:SAM-dependent methyltransferase